MILNGLTCHFSIFSFSYFIVLSIINHSSRWSIIFSIFFIHPFFVSIFFFFFCFIVPFIPLIFHKSSLFHVLSANDASLRISYAKFRWVKNKVRHLASKFPPREELLASRRNYRYSFAIERHNFQRISLYWNEITKWDVDYSFN